MKCRLAITCGAVLLTACGPKVIQLRHGALAVSTEAPVLAKLHLQLSAESREVPVESDPRHQVCTSEKVVRLQVLDADDLLLWERQFPRFSFARVDSQGVTVGLEGETKLLAFDRAGKVRTDAPARGSVIPGDAVTLKTVRAQKEPSPPQVAEPEAASVSPQPSDAFDVPKNAPWVVRVAADKFAGFDETRLLRVVDTHNRVLWSLGLPEASAVAFEHGVLVITEPDGDFRMSIDGELLSQPHRPSNVPYESPLAFERVNSAPGGPLFVTSSGELLSAIKRGVIHLVGNTWRPIPKLGVEDLYGFIELPGKPPYAVTTFGDEGGAIGVSIVPVSGQAEFPGERPSFEYPKLAAAHSGKTVVYAGYQSLVVVNGADTRVQKLAMTPAAVAIVQGRIFFESSEGEFNPPLATLPAGTVACSTSDTATPVIAELVGDKLVKQPVTLKGPITAMGVDGDRLWVSGNRELATLQAGVWKTMPSPLESVVEFWSPHAGIIWAVGVGGVARFDGSTWRRVLGLRGAGLSIRGRSEDDVWVSTLSGLFHGTKQPGPVILHVQLNAESDVKPARWNPLPLTPKPSRLTGVEHFTLPKFGTKPFHPHAASWIGDKLLLSNGTVHVFWDPKAPKQIERVGASGKSHLCFACGARDDRQEIWTVRDDSLVTPKHPALAASVPDLGPIRAITEVPGALWVVGDVQAKIPNWRDEQARFTDRTPVQLAFRANGVWHQFGGLLPATYLSVSVRSPSDAWLAGAGWRPLGGSQYDQPSTNFPSGEGIIAHVRGNAVEHFRSRLGSIGSIAEDAPNSAWAVGVAGQILHVTDAVKAFTLASPIALRDVAAVSPTERWVVGDQSTILHATSAGWETLESSEIPADQSLTRVLLDRDENVWILGYGGLYRIKKSR